MSSTKVDMNAATNSQYGKVLFHNIRKEYSMLHGIECFFEVSDDVKRTPSDSVGLFIVGFKDLHECLLKKRVTDTVTMKQCIQFTGNDLENAALNLQDFYQFLYIGADNVVYGASTPFQVQVSHEDLILDDDFLVIEPEGGNEDYFPLSVHQEVVRKAVTLAERNGILTKELEAAQRQLGSVKEIERRNARMTRELMYVQNHQRMLSEEKKVNLSLIEKMREENENLKENVANMKRLEQSNMQLNSEVAVLQKDHSELSKEKEISNELLIELSSMNDKIMTELHECSKKEKDVSAQLSSLQEQFDIVNAEKENQIKLVSELRETTENLLAELREVALNANKEEMACLQKKYDEAIEDGNVMRGQILDLVSEKERLSLELSESLSRLERNQEALTVNMGKLGNMETFIEENESKFEAEKMELNSKLSLSLDVLSDLRGRNIELKTALNANNEEMACLQKKCEEATEDGNVMRRQILDLVSEKKRLSSELSMSKHNQQANNSKSMLDAMEQSKLLCLEELRNEKKINLLNKNTIDARNEEIDTLNSKIVELKENHQMALLHLEMVSNCLREETRDWKSNCDQNKKIIEACNEEIDTLKTKIAKLKESHRMMEKQSHEYLKKFQRTHDAFKQAEADNFAMSTRMQQYLKERLNLEAMPKDFKAENQRLITQLDACRSENSNLRAATEELKMKISEIETQLSYFENEAKVQKACAVKFEKLAETNKQMLRERYENTVRDLESRLQQAAEHYQELFRQNMKLERKCKK